MNNSDTKKIIKRDFQIKKFSAYGFLKNLKFFEPYLLIYLLGNGLTLLQIGILISVKEIIINLFEIPSGLIADIYGRKRELCVCFAFYIISFVFYFLTNNFLLATIAMIFFGLGEAFRSGTHKAMIYTYLELKKWDNEKTFVYGRTRSFSLLGSAISSLMGIVLILGLPKSSYIFLVAIVPYLLDFILIASYPKELDKTDLSNTHISSLKEMIRVIASNIKKGKNLKKLLLSNGIYESMIDSTKDLIQPIFESIFIGSGLIIITGLSQDKNLKIALGISYFIIYILSSKASKNSYKLYKYKPKNFWLNAFFILLIVVFISLYLLIKSIYFVFFLYIGIYLLGNFRKPIYLDVLDDNMNRYERATMLSFSAQVKSLFTIISAPIIGYMGDNFGLNYALLTVAILLLLLAPASIIRNPK